MGGWTPLKQLLEEERNFFHDVIGGIGISYNSFLNAYDNPDRGYTAAKELFELFSVFSEEQDEEFIEVPESESKRFGYLESESGHFPRLLKLASAAREYIPAMDADLEIMKRLRETYLEPTREIIYKTVPESVEKRGEKLILLPEEVVKVGEAISAIRTEFDRRDGINNLRYNYFAKGIPVDKSVKRFIPSLDAFGYRWNNHWSLGAGDDAIDRFGFINLCIIDSLDNSTVARSLESDNPEEVLLNYVPRQGIDKVIFKPGRDRLRGAMREDLRTRSHKNNMCTVNMIRRRGNQGKYLKYIRRLKKDLRIKEKTTPGIA